MRAADALAAKSKQLISPNLSCKEQYIKWKQNTAIFPQFLNVFDTCAAGASVMSHGVKRVLIAYLLAVSLYQGAWFEIMGVWTQPAHLQTDL